MSDVTRLTMMFVIPVRDDAHRLRRCLDSIRRNNSPHESVDCVVADNGSSDDSVAVAREAGAAVLSIPGVNVATVRNRAAAAAAADLLAFVDADHELVDSWVASAIETMDSPKVGAAGALYLPPPDGTRIQKVFGVLRGRTIGRSPTSWLGSGNLVVRRSVFEALGGFDERLETCEDVDFCQRLRAAGWQLIADERLKSVHWGDPATLRAVMASERWRGRDNLRVSLRRMPAWRDWPSIIVPIVGAGALVVVVLASLMAPFAGGLAIAAASMAVIVVAGLSSLRAIRMIASGALRRPTDWMLAFAVALAYDLGRALSLILPAGHRARRKVDVSSGAPAAR